MNLAKSNNTKRRAVGFKRARLSKIHLLIVVAIFAVFGAVYIYKSQAATVTCDKVAATNGSDNNSGTVASPYLTAQKLVDNLAAGQTGCLREGSYNTGSQLKFNSGGTSDAARKILTSYPNEKGTLTGKVIYIPAGSNFVTLDNLNITLSTTVASPSIQVYGDDVTISNNDITNSHQGESAIIISDYSGSFARVVNRFKIIGNKIHDSGKLANGAHDHGIYVASSQDGIITDNLIYGNEGGWGIQLWTHAMNTTITHNVVDGNYNGSLILSGDNNIVGGPSSNNTISQNIFSNPTNRYNIETFWANGNVGTNNVFTNNCMYNAPLGNFYNTTGLTQAGTVTANPNYVDRANKDFRLQSGSSCLSVVGYDTAAKLAGDSGGGTPPTTGDYYVATDGNDNNPGTSALPFKTLQKAADSISGCKTVIVKDGTYTVAAGNAFVTTSKAGNSSCSIKFTAENKWGAKLDGQKTSRAAFVLGAGAQYINIENFEMMNFSAGQITSPASNSGDAAAIDTFAGGANSTFKGNKIHDIGLNCTNTTNGEVGIFVQSPNITIDSNYIYNIGRYQAGENGCGTSYTTDKNHDHGIYVNGQSGGGGGSGSSGAVIKNNIFNNTYAGFAIQLYPGTLSNVKVMNNTFYSCNSSKSYACIILGATFTNVNIQNNIFSNPSGVTMEYYSGPFTNFLVSNNITSGASMLNVATPSGMTMSSNQSNTNAFLVNPAGGDFRLQTSSPAINSGITSSDVTSDFAGTSRPQGAGYDIGAYEYVSSGGAAKQGDLNNDGLVNIFDLSILLTNFGKTKAQSSNQLADLNNDNIINIFDLSILLSKYGT